MLNLITCSSLPSVPHNMSHNTPDLSSTSSFFSNTGLTPSAKDTSPDLLLFRRLLGEHPKGLLLFLVKCPIAVFSGWLLIRFSFVLRVLLRTGFFLFRITITSDGRFHFGELSDIWSANTIESLSCNKQLDSRTAACWNRYSSEGERKLLVAAGYSL